MANQTSPECAGFCYSYAMFSLGNLLIGIGIFVAGVCFVKFSYQILRFTGQQAWIERYTGSGSTNGFYKIFGMVLVLIGLLVATGFGNDVIAFFITPFKSVFAPLATGN